LAWTESAGGRVNGFEVEIEGGGKFEGREEGVFDGEVQSDLSYGVFFSGRYRSGGGVVQGSEGPRKRHLGKWNEET